MLYEVITLPEILAAGLDVLQVPDLVGLEHTQWQEYPLKAVVPFPTVRLRPTLEFRWSAGATQQLPLAVLDTCPVEELGTLKPLVRQGGIFTAAAVLALK